MNTRKVSRWPWIILFAVVMLLSLFRSAFSAPSTGSFTAHVTANGQPLIGAEYTLDGDAVSVPAGGLSMRSVTGAQALIGGVTGEDGSIFAPNIGDGEWSLQVGCVVEHFEIGEVNAAVQMNVDATCYPMVYFPIIGK